ncbi:excinuclease ABC subunit UvrA [Candidatus Marinimicrobia bacterium]|nr:excinuclease ABC subunit UvrA [Candidatus Neomarinimicrobiota bacterium]
MKNTIKIKGARAHNLKNISVDLPRNKFIVITGLSGSGKSSLAFDTLYAEGQRRYVESLSSYARQFLGIMAKPDVDKIEGLSPAISIEQKARSKNPRSTVGTITEIYDYLRLLYARVGIQKCYKCNQIISKQSVQQIVDSIMNLEKKTKFYILAPVIKLQKGTHKDLLNNFLKEGFLRARINNENIDLTNFKQLNKNKKHNIDLIIDRLIISERITERLTASVELALKISNGEIKILTLDDKEYYYNENLACLNCNISYDELEPRNFSFNSPFGACKKCDGLGTNMMIDPERIILDINKSIIRGCIATAGEPPWHHRFDKDIKQLSNQYKFDLNEPWKYLSIKIKDIILYGVPFKKNTHNTFKGEVKSNFTGVIPNLQKRYTQTQSGYIRDWIEKFMTKQDCVTCKRQKLKQGSLSVYIDKKNISSLCDLAIADLIFFFKNLNLTPSNAAISKEIIKEIISRLQFLDNVGLGYLNLSRNAVTLSGGESQRIRLATQIGSQLVGVMYILDEPSIGLHSRDNSKLIQTLIDLKNLGNTVIVVEHDSETMKSSDWIIDLGKGAGIHGGNIIYEGTYKNILKDKKSTTGLYLSKKLNINILKKAKRGNNKAISLLGASGNNLKNLNISFPLNKFICVTGVSGSGKSTLINHTLYPCLANQYFSSSIKPMKYQKIEGLSYIDKVIDINQSPIGKTPRSNPATYTGVFTEIRDLFSNTNESKVRGYKSGRFSFNVKGGRCESCQGMGVVKVEMHFLPDMYIECDQCKGKRFNRETLQIKFKNKNISEVLSMSIEEAKLFYKNHNTIVRKLNALYNVGLGYIKLGQQATTLSGGESQRVKLSKELSKVNTGRTMYLLDEPTTGLHFEDIQLLLNVLHDLADKGNSIIVIEHNLDVIKTADWVIDLGPEGGDNGGTIVGEGTPQHLSTVKNSYTGRFLKEFYE